MNARDIIKESIDVGMEIGRLKCRADMAEKALERCQKRVERLAELIINIDGYCANETCGAPDPDPVSIMANTISSMIEEHRQKHGAL